MDFDFDTAFSAYGSDDGETAFPVSVYVYVKVHEDEVPAHYFPRKVFQFEIVSMKAFRFDGSVYPISEDDKLDWGYEIESSINKAFEKRRSA